MMELILLLQLSAATGRVSGQIDSACRAYCQILAIQDGKAMLIDQTPPFRDLDLGSYIAAAQPLVPRTEAPVRDLRSSRGWRVVASVFLDHKQSEVLTRIRFFDPGGVLQWKEVVMESVEESAIGTLFGGSDEVFAMTSNEEHAYNVLTEIWLLPASGRPTLLLTAPGTYQGFSDGRAGSAAGVMLARQTYDGVHADTKGIVEQFYAWNRTMKTLEPRAK
jgi:hypothetical protein